MLRVESLSVEGMMSRSFREADHQKNMLSIKQKVKKVEAELKLESLKDINEHLQPLVKFFDVAYDYIQTRRALIVCMTMKLTL